MLLCVIFDKLAEESGPVFESKTVAVAQRQYRNLVAQGRISSGDYQLLVVGAIDHATNRLTVNQEVEDVTPEGVK